MATDSLRIALVTRCYPPLIGGAEKVLSYLAAALAEAGAHVTVLTSSLLDSSAHPPEDAPPACPPPPRLTVVRLATTRLRFVGTWQYMRNLRMWFARNEVDLAYVSMLKHDAYVTVDAGRTHGFPVVLRPEGAGATGDLAWQAWGRFGKRIGERCKQADAFVAISPAIRAELLSAGYDPGRIHDLPNGVPVPEEPWQPRPGWLKVPHAVFIGRLAPEKALSVLVEAWPRVRESFASARLTLVGEGPERAALEAQVERLGLAGAVSLPGAMADPTSILREADAFVLPSVEEGMSIALLEAMALGVPVVATSIPGNQGLLTDRKQGRLVAAGDSKALADAIVAQWTDPEAAREQGMAARRRVVENHSIAAVARRHLELFERLIRSGSRARSRTGGVS